MSTFFERARRKLIVARTQFMAQLQRFSKDELMVVAPGEVWSPLQVAYHLTLNDAFMLKQVRRVQEEDRPCIEHMPYLNPEGAELTSLPASLREVLVLMEEHRRVLFVLLSSLSEDAWLRAFSYGESEEHPFFQLITLLAMQDQMHTQQLQALHSSVQR